MHEIINKISNLSLNTSEEEIFESLNELKSAVLKNGDISRSILGSNGLFIQSFENYANDSDQNALIVCEIVEISLSNLPLQDPASFVIIEQLMNSKQFARLAVRKLQKECKEISKCVPKSTVLLIIECLKSPQVQIGPPSIEILTNLLSDVPELLDDADIKCELNSIAEVTQSEIKCRAYDIAVGVATKGFSHFEKTRFLLDSIVNELVIQNDDVLLQMNLLEILQSLCAQDYGLNYLEEKGVVLHLIKKVEAISEDPLMQLLVPSLMKFFGNIAAVYPQKIYSNYSALVDLLFECLLSEEHSPLTYSALDTLGNLCKYDDGKRSMDATFGERVGQVLSRIYQRISNYPSEIKVRAFMCLENVFCVDGGDHMNNQIAYICQKWAEFVFSATNFSTLLTYCNVPFEDLSLGAFGLLKALVKHQIGQQKVSSTGGFVEFLLDRKNGSNSSYELKQRRFEVNEILAKSTVLNATQIAQFNSYIREGPNYVEPMSQVEFDPS